ncbi:N-acyl homoserine lactonase family protein [Labrys wisconsinensis]|uniref:Glyoxylase-like metal-dependent hydrolase (Beta-lactamase superfamily II) n=1 Tax=Labrys wisconsinensis TaxID=425677 RepID=A0ABU0JG18_9HYPH|nr:N-acyl homoserine lactonase family protein [Labrys wisconsinensis]MDQ0473228.1 glyoxylase-like metal-dependent hydrolase (beta-lactamase superfamily II) [Labrys wisconsinensis]
MADYSIWVLDYAAVAKFPQSVMLYGPQYQGVRNLPYAYVLIKGKGEVILVDTGYDHKEYGKYLADLYGVSNWHPAHEVLAECGVRPEDVTTVFITHAHFDHMGGLDLFPNATFYLQKRELDKWIWALALGPEFRFLVGAADPADIVKATRLAQEGRMVLIDGDREDVLPGIDVHLAADTHTYGSMYVTVRNDGAPESQDSWILAGDLLYTYDNLTGLEPAEPQIVPIGLAVGSQTNLIFTSAEMLRAVGGEPRRVIPVHEDRLKTLFPSRRTAAGLHVVEIALAADEASRVA